MGGLILHHTTLQKWRQIISFTTWIYIVITYLYSYTLEFVESYIMMTKKNKMKPTNPNAHTYVNGTDVKTHGYAVTHNTFLQ